MEDDLQKNGRRPQKNKNGRRPKKMGKKIETTKKENGKQPLKKNQPKST